MARHDASFQCSPMYLHHTQWIERGCRKRNILSPDLVEQSTQTPRDLYRDKLLDILSEDLGALYENKTDSDCILKVGDEQLPVHRVVLSARSDVFAAMFRHDTSENRSCVVDVPNVEPAVLSDVIRYVYSGQVRGLSEDTAVSMCFVADKYALLGLRDVCLDFLMRNITMENVGNVVVFAHALHEVSELKNSVIQFIKDNSEELMDNNSWKEFSKTQPLLAMKYLHYALISSSSHETQKN